MAHYTIFSVANSLLDEKSALGETVERIFEGVGIKEQGYNPTLTVLRLSNKCWEAACEFAIGAVASTENTAADARPTFVAQPNGSTQKITKNKDLICQYI